jgi:hypothetical protein
VSEVVFISKFEDCWLDKNHLAEYFDCSPRWVVAKYEEGMPASEIAGKLKFKVSEVEPWLEERGEIKRKTKGAIREAIG